MAPHHTSALDWLAVTVERLAVMDPEAADDVLTELEIERAREAANDTRPRLRLVPASA